MGDLQRRLIYRVGAFVTDGSLLCEVVDRCELGSLTLEDAATGRRFDIGMDAMRRRFWLVRPDCNGTETVGDGEDSDG